MVHLGNEPRSFCHFWDCTQVLHFRLFVDYDSYSISSKAFYPTVVDIMVLWIKFTILIHFSSLIPNMLMFTLAISCLTTSNLPWFTNLTLQVPMWYSFFFNSFRFAFTTRNIHSWVSFLFWPNLFILSGNINKCLSLSPISILDTFQPGGFIFWCHIFLPFHTVHGVLTARILVWFAIPSSSGSHFFKTLHCGPSFFGSCELHWVTQTPSSRQGCDPFVGWYRKQMNSRKTSTSFHWLH